MRRSGLLLVWLLWAGIAGCGPLSSQPLPTQVSLATLPIPPTPILQTPIPTQMPAPTQTAVSSPTSTATPPPTRCASPGQLIQSSAPLPTAGQLNYRVYLPPCYAESDHAYPVLTLLPGNIHTDAIWDDLGIDETADRLIFAGEIVPLIMVMPDGGWLANNSSGGPGSYETAVHHELRPYLSSQYCIWNEPAGQAIGGLSRGGYWALEIAFRFPDQYVSVGGHSAALYDSYAGPAVNPQTTGLTNSLGDLRIYLDFGDNDYLIGNTQRLHEGMLSQGIAHDWVIAPGGHDNAYWSSQLEAYLRWYTAVWADSPFPRCAP